MLVMTYWNPVLQYGVDRFADDLRRRRGSGAHHARHHARLGAPTGSRPASAPASTGSSSPRRQSTDARLAQTVAASRGFVYAVSTMGITGARADVDAAARVARRPAPRGRRRTTRTCVGIGISTAEQVAEVLAYADGAIVGSALVTALAEGGVAGVAPRRRPHWPRES